MVYCHRVNIVNQIKGTVIKRDSGWTCFTVSYDFDSIMLEKL